NKCKSCPVKDQCTKAKYGKGVQRSEYQKQINRNRERIEQNQDYYRRRQAIVEHPYGTIKRQWGFSYILTKKFKERASADVGFMFIAYNLRRIMNIVGKKALKKYLEVLILLVSGKYRPIRFKISLLKAIKYLHKILTSCFEGYLNRRKFDQNLLITEGF
ncbi:MAG: transposase, partial [Bacteroidales bacterium]|nr:transposase [Bacteroidales bacterium]